MTDWPIYERKLLTIGDLKSPVGICTLWSRKETVTKQLDPSQYCVVGNLYSGPRGIDPMFRNILARPSLRRLIVCGSDLSGSGQAVIDFFAYGFERGENDLGQECWRIKSTQKGIIDLEVPEQTLTVLRSGVLVLDWRGRTDIAADLQNQNLEVQPPFLPEPAIFPKREPQATTFPAEESAHVIRGNYVVEVWVQLLDEILRFGAGGESHYQDHLEVPNLITVVEGEDPDNPKLYPWLQFNSEDLERYCVQVLSSELPLDARYGYGHRIHTYFGYDQRSALIEKIKRDPEAKSGVIGIWDPFTDLTTPKSPCINHLWFKIVRGKLFLTATIRSNDMFGAWLGNAFSLRRLQKRVAEEVCGGKMGALTVNSESAHLYKDSWDPARIIVERHWKEVVPDPRLVQDPRGSWLIKVDEEAGEIVAEHISPANESLQVVRGRSALAVYTQIARRKGVLLVEHALYLGSELGKAETALKRGLSYVQDQLL